VFPFEELRRSRRLRTVFDSHSLLMLLEQVTRFLFWAFGNSAYSSVTPD
jgi:hypothetical protein